jgi:hypothetical protein
MTPGRLVILNGGMLGSEVKRELERMVNSTGTVLEFTNEDANSTAVVVSAGYYTDNVVVDDLQEAAKLLEFRKKDKEAKSPPAKFGSKNKGRRRWDPPSRRLS